MGTISTVTIGTVSYSVYAITANPVTDATDYLNAKIGATAWASATTDDQMRSLVSAARWIDRVSKFTGTLTVDPQPRAWPRDGATCDSTAIADGTTPDDLAYAEFELALVLLDDAAAQDAQSQGSNVKRAKAGSAEVEFFGQTLGTSADTKLPSIAHDRIKCLLDGSGSITGGFASGITDTSAFPAPPNYDRSGGFF